ncbi:MAG: prepilin-type N-terminal cleavage/methylation domain-containing protein [Patescibacteria group bacterium]
MSRLSIKNHGAKGFTLIELLIVIGIIGILAAIILVAVDPAKRLKQARNARRYAEANAILNAILNYTVDYKGKLPTQISSATANVPFVIGENNGTGNLTLDIRPITGTTLCPNHLTGAGTATHIIAVATNTALVDEYISSIPVDPRGTNDTDTYDDNATGYYIKRSTNGRIEVGACNPESEDNITTPSIKIKR